MRVLTVWAAPANSTVLPVSVTALKVGSVVPDVRKAVKWNSPFYGIEGKGFFLGIHCFAKYVKIAFFRGSSLRPEPPGTVRTVVLLGVGSCIVAGLVELLLMKALGPIARAQGRFLEAFAIAALVEEFVKLACVLGYLWNKPQFDEVMDGILYTAAASLGFAMLENVLYVGNNVVTAIVRAFTAVPLHAIASGLMSTRVTSRPWRSAASPNEPLPAKKSSSRSPGFVWTFTIRSRMPSGFCVG